MLRNSIPLCCVFLLMFTVMSGVTSAQEDRRVIEINKAADLTESALPGFIQVRYQKPDRFWQACYLHIPVAEIEQINVEPDTTKLYIKSLKLPEATEMESVVLEVSDRVQTSGALLQLIRRALVSANRQSE